MPSPNIYISAIRHAMLRLASGCDPVEESDRIKSSWEVPTPSSWAIGSDNMRILRVSERPGRLFRALGRVRMQTNESCPG
jgi:hypothetical protein